MTARAWLWFLARDLLRQPARPILVAACIAVAAATIGATAGAFLLLAREIEPRLRALFPENRIVVRARPLEVSILRFDPVRINDRTIASLRAQPGVGRVLPQLAAGFPSSAIITFEPADAGFVTDVILHGAPRNLIAAEIPPAERFTHDGKASARPVPVLVSAFFLDLFNMGLADNAGLPRLSPRAVIGREFDLTLGRSTVADVPTTAPSRTVRARVVGLTADPRLVGVVVPIDTLAAWNTEFAAGRTPTYTALNVDLADPAAADLVLKAARDAGLEPATSREQLARLASTLATIRALFAGFAALVTGLALVGAWTTLALALRERRRAWGVYHACGMTTRQLIALTHGSTFLLALGAGIAACAMLSGAGAFIVRGPIPLPSLVGADALAGALAGPVALAVALVAAQALTLPPVLAATIALARSRAAGLVSEHGS